MPADYQTELLAIFAAEADKLSKRLLAASVRIEGATPEARPPLLEQMRADLHTLKGSAATVERYDIRDVCHGLETLIDVAMNDGELTVTTLDIVHHGLDLIASPGRFDDEAQLLLDEISAHQPVEAPARPTITAPASADIPTGHPQPIASEPPERVEQRVEQRPSVADASVQVGVAELERMHGALGDLVVNRLSLQNTHALSGQLRQLTTELSRLSRSIPFELRALRRSADAASWRRFERSAASLVTNIKQTQRLSGDLHRRLTSENASLALRTEELEDTLHDLRMRPVTPYLAQLAASARAAGRERKREFKFEINESRVRVDRVVLERIRAPLIHLVTNAIVHGIEPPDERIAAGKSRTGTVNIETSTMGDRVEVRVIDDGRGIDRAAVVQLARRDSVDPDGEALSNAELLDAICQPGLTTVDEVTGVAGRGVGMDAVQRAVRGVSGSLEIERTGPSGTVFVLSMPVRLTSARGLILQLGGNRLGIPTDAVVRIRKITDDQIGSVGGVMVITSDDQPISVAELDGLLGCALARPAGSSRVAIILRAGAKRAAVLVDDVLGELPLVVRPLGPQFDHLARFAGGALEADGAVLPVLDAAELLRMIERGVVEPPREARRLPTRTEPVNEERPLILVVDDSITTRTLERGILEGAGYRVQVASDGQEALEMLRADDSIDLVVTDVQMPRMDGVGLCRHIREGSRAHMPVIMVTSMKGDADRIRGLQAGADAYIVKGVFDQAHFLGTVRRLVG